MLGLLLRWIVGAITLFVIAYFVPGFHIRGWASALIAVLVIGLLNATLGLLLKILTFPLSILTLGLFLLVINAFMLMIASRLVPGFHVDTFGSAFVGAVILAVVHMLLGMGTRSDQGCALTECLAADVVDLAGDETSGHAWGQACAVEVPRDRVFDDGDGAAGVARVARTEVPARLIDGVALQIGEP